MFTPAGAQSRVTRNTRRVPSNTADRPVLAVSGPPSYSYGSPSNDLPTIATIQDTQKSITSAFNAAVKNTYERTETSASTDLDTVSLADRNVYNETPKRKSLALSDIEASVNRKRSLRSATKSKDGDSADSDSTSEMADTSEDDGVSLEYDVTQSSPLQDLEEEAILREQLLRPQKASEYSNTGSVKRRESDPWTTKSLPLPERLLQQLDFAYFIVRRLARWPLSAATNQLRRCKARDYWLSLLMPLLVVISIIGLCLYNPETLHFDIGKGFTSHPHYIVPDTMPHNVNEIATRLFDIEKSLAGYYSFAEKRNSAGEDSMTALRNVETDLRKFEESFHSIVNELRDVTSQLSSLTRDQSKTDRELKDINEELERIASNQNGYNTTDTREAGFDIGSLKSFEEKLEVHIGLIHDLEARIEPLPKVEILRHLATLHGEEVDSECEDHNVTKSISSGIWKKLKNSLYQGPTPDDTYGFESNSDILPEWIETQINDLPQKATGRIIDGSQRDTDTNLREELIRLLEEAEQRLRKELKNSSSPGHATQDRSWRIDASNKLDTRSEAVLLEIVQEAIKRHSSDILGRPDYASYLSGARVNPFLTSATFLHRPTALIPRIASKLFFDIGTVKSHPPAIAIHPSNAVGMCWSFPGHAGQLSVKLSTPIRLTDVAVEHIHPDIAHDVTSAPRQIEIWAQIADDSSQILESVAASTSIGDHVRQAPGPSFMHIMDLEYNVFSVDGIVQTFAVPQAMKAMNIPVRQVVYRIKSNWGNDRYTCLYRVRAIGLADHHREEDITSDEDI